MTAAVAGAVGGSTLRRLRRSRTSLTAVLIGSQRANYLVEYFVAGLLGCRPFSETRQAVPFYLNYQEKARVRSCFGGNRPAVQGPACHYNARPPRRGARTGKEPRC